MGTLISLFFFDHSIATQRMPMRKDRLQVFNKFPDHTVELGLSIFGPEAQLGTSFIYA